MDSNGFFVRGRSFRMRKDYEAALRDQKKIETILKKYENAPIEKWKELLDDLEHRAYPFETLVGEDFTDEVDEKIREMEKHPVKSTKGTKAKKTSVKHPKEEVNTPKKLEDYDKAMQQQILLELKAREKKRKRFVGFCSIVAFLCLGYVIAYFFFYQKNDMEYEKLAAIREKDSAVSASKEPVVHLTTEEQVSDEILEKYKTLYNKNKSLIGWVKIDDTNIDYPVMQTQNNEYYLDHNYNQEYDKNGSIFLDMACNPLRPNTNLIIYGHHMKSGKMFGNLNAYSNRSYYEDHKYIQFDTIYQEGLYQVMYVFRSHIYNEDEIVFKYYQFIDAATPEEFDSNMQEMSQLALYDTGVTAVYGDKLLTLSTCDSAEADGRFVVVAKKIQ